MIYLLSNTGKQLSLTTQAVVYHSHAQVPQTFVLNSQTINLLCTFGPYRTSHLAPISANINQFQLRSRRAFTYIKKQASLLHLCKLINRGRFNRWILKKLCIVCILLGSYKNLVPAPTSLSQTSRLADRHRLRWVSWLV